MLAQRPGHLFREELSEKVNPKYIYGYKGWLFVITGLFLLLAYFRINFVVENVKLVFKLNKYDERFRAWLWLLVAVVAILIPICISFVLYFRRINSIYIAKFCIVLQPIVAFVGFVVLKRHTPDYLNIMLTTFLPSLLIISLPAFLYLQFSRRVKNTYLFYYKRLPKKITCPFCLTQILPTEEERTNKELTCVKCNNEISQYGIID